MPRLVGAKCSRRLELAECHRSEPVLSRVRRNNLMWCPGCNSDSPMVAVLHSGLVCARCECEVLSERPMGVPVHLRAASRGAPVAGESGFSAALPADTPVFRFDASHPTTGSGAAASREPRPGAATVLAGKPQGRWQTGTGPLGAPASFTESGNAASGSPVTISLTRALLVFFCGQLTTAIAWFSNSFPAFAVGVVLTLAGTGWLLQRAQGPARADEAGASGSRGPAIRPRRASSTRRSAGQRGW